MQYQEKYGTRASSGGGRSSARETIARVAAGAIAEKCLDLMYGVEIVGFVSAVGNEQLYPPTELYPSASTNPAFLKLIDSITRKDVDDFLPVRCPNKETGERMAQRIGEFRDKQDSIGGVVTCVIRNCPVGLGEPVFDKLEALLAHAMLSIPSTKGFEIGSGFAGCDVPGSVHNDAFISAPIQQNGSAQANGSASHKTRRLRTRTNNSGGVQGGISNGENIFFRVAFKPPATIGQAQETSNYEGTAGVLEAKGRHDPCVVPRAVPIVSSSKANTLVQVTDRYKVEAMAALVLMDLAVEQSARQAAMNLFQS